MRKFLSLRKEIFRRAQGEKFPFEGGEIFLRKKKKFPYVRKFISVRTEIFRLAPSGHSLGARRIIWMGEEGDRDGRTSS